MNASQKILQRLIASLTLFVSASGALILFVVVPFALLEHWRLLPDWRGLRLIYLLFPLVIAWNHAGFLFVLIVIGGEVVSAQLNPPDRKAKVEGVLKISVCVLTALFLELGNRYNPH